MTKQVFKNANGVTAEVTLQNPDTNTELKVIDISKVLENKEVIILDSIPTSDPNNIGQLWNDSGVLKISNG